VVEALAKTLEVNKVDKPEYESRSLVMLSGGIDSVAVLATLLTETEHQVHAHHIELSNRDNRQQAENDAVADVVDYCWQHYRDFSFSTSKSEFKITQRGYDLIFTMFHAALVSISSVPGYDFVMTGHFQTSKLRAMYGQQMLDSCFLRDSAKPRWIRPLDALTDEKHIKIDIYRSVPDELAALSWSCRKPVETDGELVPCGCCYACRNLDVARSTTS
jgi:7-cyano-7-deazaguanine synthase in queuosine biosynthesis